MWKKKLFYGLIALAAVLFLITAQFPRKAVETAAWGLSFPKDGEAPQGPATREQLAPMGAAFVGSPDEKVLYLTFDSGYENGSTGKILDTLKAHDVKAAFFLAGNYVQRNPDLVRRMAAEGHIVGNHTMHHPDMTRLKDPKAFSKEILDLEAMLRELTGQEPAKFYRPPQGMYSEKTLEMAQELGYKTVFWSLAYVDWQNDRQPTREQALRKLLPRTHNGAVILLHCTSSTNAQILDELLTTWEKLGYRFGTLPELFQDTP